MTEPTISLEDLHDDWMLVSDGGCEPLLRQQHETTGIPFRPDHRAKEMITLLAMVREGLGVTVIPELALTDRHGLVAIPLQPNAQRQLTLTTGTLTTPPTAAAQAFQDLARQHAPPH